MKVSGPMKSSYDGQVIEDMIIYADPTEEDNQENDYALKIPHENVTVRNVIIYHAVNGIGLYGWKSNNLILENVQVIAYGNEWGA